MTDSAPPNQLRDPDIFWLHRWLALKKTIQATRKSKDTKEPFKGLLCNLLAFGQKQFLYFFLGFTHSLGHYKENKDFEQAKKDGGFGAASPKLIKDYDYPPEYVLRTILDQIAVDFEIIQRAMHQRQHGTEFQQETLNLADKWGQELLGRVKKMIEFSHGDEKVSLHPKVITYFNRSPLIRMIPYDNVALIGIPLTATRPDHRRDLLVIGHELGHYAYWHGQVNGQSIREILRYIVRGEMPYIKNWIEEIFSDVFGFVVSKQLAMSLWALEMIADNLPSEYVHDNRVHPIDLLRPYLFLLTLSTLELSPHTRDSRAGNVAAIVKDRGGHEYFRTIDWERKEIKVKLGTAKNTLQTVIVKILDNILPKLKTEENWDVGSPVGWWNANQSLPAENKKKWEEEKERRYKNFEKTIDPPKNPDSNIQPEKSEQKKGEQPAKTHAFVTVREANFERYLEPELWKIVFAADGWAVKGPETQPVGGWEGDSSGGYNPFHL
ncbi:MAG: hypothetical protein IPM53_28415 [Anaerolineaceae bacterium]|nr:hypothetical protein [Anaerolineaceae bacterium]